MRETRCFLKISGLTAGYRPALPIIRDIDLSVGKGEIVTIIGPNGAGKSTLIKAIAGLVIIEAGSITLGETSLVGISPDRLGHFDLAYVPQTANIFTTLTVQQNLALAARRCKAEPKRRIDSMIDLFPILQERAKIRAGALSGGQRQVLAIAMALISSPQLILMDEPTAGLSPIAAQEVLSLIRTIAQQGVSVLLVEQNAKLALGASDRAYILADGQNQHEGAADAILNDPIVGEIYLGGKRRGAA